MKAACLFLALIGAVLSVGCVARQPVALGVSDAWLNTPWRAHSQPVGPKNGLTHWKVGLPPVRKAATVALRPQAARAGKGGRDGHADGLVAAPTPSAVDSFGYGVVHTRYRGRPGRHHHVRGDSQSDYVRQVEKVGPSIVPRLRVPLSTRSSSGGPALLPRVGVAIVPAPPPRIRDAEAAGSSGRRGHRHRRH